MLGFFSVIIFLHAALLWSRSRNTRLKSHENTQVGPHACRASRAAYCVPKLAVQNCTGVTATLRVSASPLTGGWGRWVRRAGFWVGASHSKSWYSRPATTETRSYSLAIDQRWRVKTFSLVGPQRVWKRNKVGWSNNRWMERLGDPRHGGKKHEIQLF